MTDLYAHINPPDDLLVKHLLGEASVEEEQLATEWIAADPDHQKYFDGLRSLWLKSAAREEADTPSEQDAWGRFQTIIADRIADGQRPQARAIPWRKVLQVAAAVVVLIASGWLLFSGLSTAHRTRTLSSGDQIRPLTLPDGSRVTLNAHSTLSYKADFGTKTRRVQLSGEGFFDVAPVEDQPFVAEAGRLTVTVLGTRFNINGKSNSPEVVVETGKVEVTDGRESLYLGAHESAVLSAGRDQLKKRAVTGALYNYYRTGEFRCVKTPLHALVNTLAEAYHTPIVVTDSATGRVPITTTFRYDQPLDSILKIISETLGVKVTKQRDSVLIR